MNESKQSLGDTEVTVRFEYEAECLGHGDHPDYSETLTIEEVCIGGVWIAGNFFADGWLADTEQLILAERGRSLKEEHDQARWEARQEHLMEQGYP